MKSRKNSSKKGRSNSFSKLSIFQPNKYKFKKNCPLSVKNAPKVDYLIEKQVVKIAYKLPTWEGFTHYIFHLTSFNK